MKRALPLLAMAACAWALWLHDWPSAIDAAALCLWAYASDRQEQQNARLLAKRNAATNDRALLTDETMQTVATFKATLDENSRSISGLKQQVGSLLGQSKRR